MLLPQLKDFLAVLNIYSLTEPGGIGDGDFATLEIIILAVGDWLLAIGYSYACIHKAGGRENFTSN